MTLNLFLLFLSTGNIQAQAEPVDSTYQTPPGIKAFLSAYSFHTTSVQYDEEDVEIDILKEKRRDTLTLCFDPETIAMRIEFPLQESRKGHYSPGNFFMKKGPKEKQSPMYFDNRGYVYVDAAKKGSKKPEYMKVPFEKLKQAMAFSTFASRGLLPPIPFPDGSVTYYGMDVSPKQFPVLEWAFVYKTEVFEGNSDFTKEDLNCRGDAKCVKYILKSGEGAGSYVLFDSEGRLAEISTTENGYMVYTYEPVTVKLPPAREMPFMTDMFRW